jgi:tRNA pseudouridine13 synthase
MPALPYLTAAMPGIGGVIKASAEDFRVEEVPLYAASGQGDHVYIQIRKIGIPTPGAVERIAKHMGVPRTAVGFAGLKDAQAVTTQWLSIEHADERRLATFRDRQMKVLATTRHTNKLRPGHLAGNRFAVRIRQVDESALNDARAIAAVLTARGVPNYFGQQRFGLRGDTAALGRALIAEDAQEFVELFLGRPRDGDSVDCRNARAAFDAGDFDGARNAWPRHYADQRRALAAYRQKQRPGPAVGAVDKRLKRLFVSAFQSEIFNAVVARRIMEVDTLWPGDWAQKHDNGAVFQVMDVAAETKRLSAFEISPTGPIVGYRSKLADGHPGEIERGVLTAFGVTPEQFRIAGPLKVKGTRRALRFAPRGLAIESGSDEQGAFLEVRFDAPPGSYATVLLGELMKAEV